MSPRPCVNLRHSCNVDEDGFSLAKTRRRGRNVYRMIAVHVRIVDFWTLGGCFFSCAVHFEGKSPKARGPTLEIGDGAERIVLSFSFLSRHRIGAHYLSPDDVMVPAGETGFLLLLASLLPPPLSVYRFHCRL